MAKKRVIVGYKLEFEGSVELDNADIWPDGVPEEHDTKRMEKLIHVEGGPAQVCREWNLEDDLEIAVTPVYDTIEVPDAEEVDPG